MSAPRIVLSGHDWRVVAIELPDQHGVIRTEYIIELTHAKAKDAMGTQIWTALYDKSALGDWVKAGRRFLDALLEAAGEQPDAKNF